MTFELIKTLIQLMHANVSLNMLQQCQSLRKKKLNNKQKVVIVIINMQLSGGLLASVHNCQNMLDLQPYKSLN